MNPIKERTIATMLAMSIHVLLDEFGFGAVRIRRFKDRFDCKVDCLVDDMVSWGDIIEDIENRTKIKIAIPQD